MSDDTAGGAPGPVDRIVAAVLACPAVAGLHGGRYGEITTYLPGRRAIGVTVSPAEVVVGVVGRYPTGIGELAAQVRAAVTPHAGGRRITVSVEDLVLPDEPVPDGEQRDTPVRGQEDPS